MAQKDEFIILPAETTSLNLVASNLNGRQVAYLDAGKSRYVSDGYHTFDDLYMFRLLYNAALFNTLGSSDPVFAHKSTKHADGEDCFGGGWFIVVAYLNSQQISNHYKLEYWDYFKIEARQRADEWDGHTPEDVMQRLTDFVKEGNFEKQG
jgi:hypothetical protein